MRGKSLSIVEELIYSHAVGIDSDNDALRQWSALQGHRSRLAELRFDLRLMMGEARKDLRRKIRKRRTVKGSQLDRLLSENFQRGKETLEMTCRINLRMTDTPGQQ